MTGGPLLHLGARHSPKLGFYLPGEIGRLGYYLLCWIHFKEMVPRSLRKISLGCETGKRLLKKRFTCQRGPRRDL